MDNLFFSIIINVICGIVAAYVYERYFKPRQ